MLADIIFFAPSLFLGLLLMEVFKIYFSLPLRIGCGFVVGTVANLLIIFLVANILGLNFITTLVPLVFILILTSVLLVRSHFSLNLEEIKFPRDLNFIIPIFLISALIFLIFYKSIYVSDDSIIAGNRLVWVDWPIHISLISSFVFGNNFPPQNPLHAGGVTTYPFFIEFLSAILQSLGATLKNSLVAPGIIFTLTLIYLLYAFGRIFFDKCSVAILGIYVGLFWGGLGFIYFFRDLTQSSNFLQTLFFPPNEYTFYSQYNLWFFTPLYSELLPQRAFLLGSPIFFVSLILLVLGISKNSKSKILIAAYLTAILPFFHMHSFISAVIFAITYITVSLIDILKTKSKEKLKRFLTTISIYYFLPILGLGLIQLPFFLQVGSQSFAPSLGWLKGDDNFFVFWLKNTGFFWPLWIIGFLKIKNKIARNILISSLPLFILPNLFRFAPWAYDNLKIFTYWYLIGGFAVSTALVNFWHKNYLGKILAVLLFITLTLSGLLEIIRIINTDKTKIPLWNKGDIEFSKVIIERTEPESTILTAAIHDHPVTSLSGRNIVIGFPGNAWSWGYSDWQQREQDVKSMFKADHTTAPALLKKYNVDYVLIGPRERNFEPQLNENYFSQNFETVAVGSDFKLFQVK